MAVALAVQKLAQHRFAGTVGVGIGRVKEVAARRHVTIEHRPAGCLVGTPAPVGAKSHRAQAELRNTQAGMAEKGQLH